MNELIKKAAKDIAGARSVVALTGAGISVDSGIPPFRGKGGVWEKIDPDYADIDRFMRDPADVWNVLIKDMKELIDRATPNDGHKGLATLEELGKLHTVITQNVDGLHQMAGNKDVIEFHGSFAWQRCMACEKKCKTSDIDLSEIPPRCECGGIYRPEVIFFGEMIPHDALFRSREIASQCDVMLVVGTSAIVHPAAIMPVVAKQSGAKIIEINPERTPLTGNTSDYLIMGKAGQVMNGIIDELKRLNG
ncbi:SIR2 family NAD-dependent protein deacylase [Desulfonema magnum]|uniref:protein acetyllysine N-acetyltransferase n=1 Tax=Desulfonema magnum TaxID=45655 RepID=A0A975GQ22_9BACT|nr:NAD-dependent deacylase [Desulfonema magnum]QTA88498.1 Cobyrinic acid a,c-diamide synthase [Desulfonema magnum]